MGKVIIDNRSDIQDCEALELAMNVMKGGRISNFGKEYCFLKIVHNWKGTGKEYRVGSFINKKSDRFIIYKEN